MLFGIVKSPPYGLSEWGQTREARDYEAAWEEFWKCMARADLRDMSALENGITSDSARVPGIAQTYAIALQ